MIDVRVPFSPIQGLESVVLSQAITPGNLYFTTDSGKILLDTSEKRIVLGSSGAALYYAAAKNLKVNTDDSFTIPYDTLEDQKALPKKDDLIINSDGRFFKVNYFSGSPDEAGSYVNCKLIAVSGTGGSSSGSGGTGGNTGDTTDPRNIQVEYDPNFSYTFLYGSSYGLTLTASSKKTKSLNISYVVRNNTGNTVDVGNVPVLSGQTVTLPIGRNIKPEGGLHAVDLTITGVGVNTFSETINRIRCVNLSVAPDTTNFTSEKIYSSSVSYYVYVKGQISKTLHIEIDGKEMVGPYSLTENQSDYSHYVNINCTSLKLAPGIHTITAYLEADGVPSNKIHTDFIYHPEGTQDTTYVIITNYPERCLSYESPQIKYWVYDTSKPSNTQNTIIPSINGSNLEFEYHAQVEGKALLWNINALEPDQNNRCGITCNGETREITIYCEKSTIFDEVDIDTIVLLNANGRSNNTSLERRLQWEYVNDKNQTISADLINFNWKNNGWCLDDNGRSCLRISNGAKVEIPLNLFPIEKPSVGGFTIDLEFKPYNLYSYNLLTQATETEEYEDENGDDRVKIHRVFNADLAAISYIEGSGSKAYGFCCGTQDAFFRMDNGENATVRYRDNNIVNISVTINAASQQICMYVNGVMSGMTKYDYDTASLPQGNRKLIINSDQCDLDLYNIRIYNKALTFNEITQNYIASKKDLQIYNENSFTTGDTISLSALIDYNTNNPASATIPYIVFKTHGGDDHDMLPYNKANESVLCDIKFTNPALDYALELGEITTSEYLQKAPSFIATSVDLNVQGTSSQKYPRKNFKGKFKNATSWKCTHPKMENATLSKFYMRPGMGEKTFTWKADYMDSSSCHNTGFASYVYELYTKHPLDYYKGSGNEYHKKYRTSLFGFPVLAFHEKSNGTTEFIGLYNFNLDKGADSTLGMDLDEQHPILTNQKYKDVCECWEMANNMGGRCSFRGDAFDSGYDYTEKKYLAYDEEQGLIETTSNLGEDLEVRYHKDADAIEGAWENRNLPKDDEDSIYIGSEAAFEVLLGGSADGTGRTGAYRHLEKFFKWINSCFYAFDLNDANDKSWAESLTRARAIYERDNNFFENIINVTLANYRDKKQEFDTTFSEEDVGSNAYGAAVNNLSSLAKLIIDVGMLKENEHYNINKIKYQIPGENRITTYNIYNITASNEVIESILMDIKNSIDNTYTIKTDSEGKYYNAEGKPVDIFYRLVREDRKTKFENEFHNHLNMEYCMVYYIMTELLLQYDSRGKNMMFASWGPISEYQTEFDQKTKLLDADGNPIPGDYVWFPIYYDVDTQLGVNNSGIPSWEYNVEPTTGFNNNNVAAFSTSNSLLWQNFHQSYVVDKPDEVRNAYQKLRGGKLNESKINQYYNFDFSAANDYCMKGILPISVYNANQHYKYIEPNISGYCNGLKADGTENRKYTDAYYYCLQGTRELHRALFLRNRFNYYDSKWMAQSYQIGDNNDNVFWRINAYKHPTDPSLNSNLLLHIKPSLDQYIVVWPDETTPKPIFTKGGEIAEIDLSTILTNTEKYNQQIIHIGGPDYIQEYGNVSLLYLDENVFPSAATTKIEFGNENPNYKPWQEFSVEGMKDTTANKPLLKVFDITNMREFNSAKDFITVNLSDSVKLEEFKALGTIIEVVIFADGVNLSKLYLPDTMKEITLLNATSLNKIVYNRADILDENGKQTKPAMYIENLIKNDGTTNVNKINIVGGALNQHSYVLLNKLTQAHKEMAKKQGGEQDRLKISMENVHWTPFTKLGDGAEYDRSKKDYYYKATHNASFENYEYSTSESWNKDVLSGRVYYYEEPEAELATNLDLLDEYIGQLGYWHFTNIYQGDNVDYPLITGEMYINNNAGSPISEAALFEYTKYFPDLEIKAAAVTDSYRARFVTLTDGVEKEIFIQRTDVNNTPVQFPTTGIILPSHSVFAGWSKQPPTGNYENDYKHIISENDLKKYYLGNGDGSFVSPTHTFYAVFNRESYKISYKDTNNDGTPGENLFNETLEVLYGDILPQPLEIPYREYQENNSLPLDERLAFIGWTDIESQSGIADNLEIANSLVIDLTKLIATQDKTFYPVYIKENVYERPSDNKYFSFTDNKDGTTCTISDSGNYILKGKITIPAEYNGKPVTAIGLFPNMYQATHVFFMPTDKLTTIKEGAFKPPTGADATAFKIKGIYLPDSITSIEKSAFENLAGLKHVSDKFVKLGEEGCLSNNINFIGPRAFKGTQQLILKELPPNLTTVGESTFYEAGPNVTIAKLPDSVKTIEGQAFVSTGVKITEFGLRSGSVGFDSGLTSIGRYAFRGVDNGVTNIYVWDSVIEISDQAFNSYGKNVTLYTSHSSHPTGWADPTLIGVEKIEYNFTKEVS